MGSLLVFAMLVIAFSSYQVGVVPVQNSAVEWDHHKQTQNEMLDLRNAIMQAKLSGHDTFASVKLGTEFQPRLVALNPSNPTGTLQTSDPQPFEVRAGEKNVTDEVCGMTDFDGERHVRSETRLLEYEASYREFDGDGSIHYEHSVLYQSFDGTDLPRSGQRLVRGDTITILPLANEFHEQGSGRVSFEPNPGFLSVDRIADPYIELPTGLSEEAWGRLLEDLDEDEFEVIASEDAKYVELTDERLDVLVLDLEGTYNVRCGVIGIDGPPTSGARGQFPEPGADVHPAEQAGVRFLGRTGTSVGQNTVEIELENLEDSSVNLSRFTVNFHQGSDSNWVRVSDSEDFEPYTQINIGDSPAELDPQIELAGGEVVTVYLEFDSLSGGDWFMVTVQFGTGERTQWFVGT